MIAANKNNNQTCSIEQHKIQQEMRQLSKGIGGTDAEQMRRILAMSPEERKAVEAKMKEMASHDPFSAALAGVPYKKRAEVQQPAQHDNSDFSTDAEMIRRGAAMSRDEQMELSRHQARLAGSFGFPEPVQEAKGQGQPKAAAILNQLKAVVKPSKPATPESVSKGFPSFVGQH